MFRPIMPRGFYVHFEVTEKLEYVPIPFKRIPFSRLPLGYYVHFITCPKKPDMPVRDFFHSILVCVLAARIHGTNQAVRAIAWKMWQNCVPTAVVDPADPVDENGERPTVYVSTAVVMQALTLHSQPLKLVELILREIEMTPPRKKVLSKKKEPVKKGPKPKAKKGPSMKTQNKPILTQVNTGPKKAYG